MFILQSNRSILRLIIIFFFIHLFYISTALSQEEDYFQTHSFSIATNEEGLSYILGQVIVKYKSPRDEYSLTASSFNLESAQVYEVKDMFEELDELSMYKAQEYHPLRNRYYMFEVNEGADVEEVCQELMQNPDIEYAEPSYIFSLPESSLNLQNSKFKDVSDENYEDSNLNFRIPEYDFPVQTPESKFRFPIELPESNNYPNDPYFHSKGSWGQSYDDLWGLKKMQAKKAWHITKGEDIVIATVDTGANYQHPDLKDNLLPGYEPRMVNGHRVWRKTTSMHGCGIFHGTLTAGAIAGVGNNGRGIIGVAPESKIVPFVCGPSFCTSGGLYGFLIIEAVALAADMGVDIININANGPYMQSLDDVIKYAHDKDIVITAPSGNGGMDTVLSFPRVFPEVIIIGGSTPQDKFIFNHGYDLDVVGPAGGHLPKRKRWKGKFDYNILTTLGGLGPRRRMQKFIIGERYIRVAGTCLSSSYAAGVVALMRSVNPNLTNEQIRYVLRESADHIGGHFYFGHGRLNAYKAVTLAQSGPIGLKADLMYKEKYARAIREFPIIGTASGKDFKCYRLEVKASPIGKNKGKWIPISRTFYKKVEKGVLLGKQDAINIPQGWPYFRPLRLVVEGKDSKEIYAVKELEVPKVKGQPSSPPPPLPTPSPPTGGEDPPPPPVPPPTPKKPISGIQVTGIAQSSNGKNAGPVLTDTNGNYNLKVQVKNVGCCYRLKFHDLQGRYR